MYPLISSNFSPQCTSGESFEDIVTSPQIWFTEHQCTCYYSNKIWIWWSAKVNSAGQSPLLPSCKSTQGGQEMLNILLLNQFHFGILPFMNTLALVSSDQWWKFVVFSVGVSQKSFLAHQLKSVFTQKLLKIQRFPSGEDAGGSGDSLAVTWGTTTGIQQDIWSSLTHTGKPPQPSIPCLNRSALQGPEPAVTPLLHLFYPLRRAYQNRKGSTKITPKKLRKMQIGSFHFFWAKQLFSSQRNKKST